MIKHKELSDIDTSTKEGQLLMAAIAILTSINESHIKSGRWGSTSSPNDAVEKISDLANQMYYAEEYILYKKTMKRESIIDDILNEKRLD
jgi:hypothetical protein